MTTAEALRDEGMAAAEDHADPRLILAIDAAIERWADTGMPFSANDARAEFPVVRSGLVGKRIRSAAMRKPALIRKVGMTRSDLPSTKCAWIAVWQGVDR